MMQRMLVEVHPIEFRFLQQLRRWRFGTLREVKIEDGLPMCAEFVHERVRFDKSKEDEK
jgi:hypothetical protein